MALGGHHCGREWSGRGQWANERKDTHVQELARSLNYAGNQRENKLEKG